MRNGLSDKLAELINKLFNELILTCKRTDGVGDYADLLVVGYSDEPENVSIAWQGPLAGKTWVKVSELVGNQISEQEIEVEIKTRAGTRTEKQKQLCWIEPVAEGRTPMRTALNLAAQKLSEWIENHPHNFPPIVFNITDGMPTDGEYEQMLKAAKEIRDLHTSDGFVLLFNIHISSLDGEAIMLPASKDELIDNDYAKALFDYSSVIPKEFEPRIADMVKGYLKDEHVAMSFNADLKSLWRILQIGTRTTNR